MAKLKSCGWIGSAMAAALVVCCTHVHAADGNELFALGAVQRGLGGAGAASAYDATWVSLNPAATVELGRRIDISGEVLYLHTEGKVSGFPLVANTLGGEQRNTQWVAIPAMGATLPLGGGVLGGGLFGTQGNRLTYGDPRSTFGWLGNGDRSSEFEVVKFPITYAYPLGDGWAIGAGVVPTASRFRTDSVSLSLREAEADNEWDVSYGVGYILSVHKRADKWSLGAAFHSRIWTQQYEKYRNDVLRSRFDLPQKVQVGVGFRPRPDVELLLDYKWMDWDSIGQLGRKATQNGLGWRDSHTVKFGANWAVNERWAIRGGITYGRAPVREDTAFANFLTPAIAEWHLAAGVTRNLPRGQALHAALSFSLSEEAYESGRGDLFSKLGRGTRIAYQEADLTVQYSAEF